MLTRNLQVYTPDPDLRSQEPRVQEELLMHAPMKYVEKGLSIAANGVWQVFSLSLIHI